MTIAIVGVGETEPRIGDTRGDAELAVAAIHLALADAGLEPGDVDGFVSESYATVRHAAVDDIAQRLGVRDRAFSAQLSIAGAGNVGAPQLAELAIDRGLASVVVCYYGINLTGATGSIYAVHAEEPAKVAFEMPFGYYGQAVYFAPLAQRYMHEFGLTEEQLGAVAVSARQHAAQTPGSLKTEPLSIEEYLAKPMLADPLRGLDCCLVNDGGVAYVMTSVERARDLARPPVVVAGVGWGAKTLTQAQYFTQADVLTTAAAISGPRAFKAAGLSPADVDVAEVYDCFTISALMQLEDIGLAAKGDGGALAASGALDPGGSLPMNTHGGLLSHSYTVGAGHVVEAVRQLRGSRGLGQVLGAEVAVVTGLGAQDHATLVLTKDR